MVIDHLRWCLLIGRSGLSDLRLGHGGLDGLEAAGRVGIFDGLEHHVALEQFADVGLQLEGRHLEQADGLLQLRRHGQLLTHTQLQRRFQHVSCNMGTRALLRA